MSTAPLPRMSFEEYVAWEEHQVEKHEYFDGQVYAMSGATYAHDVISNNLKFIIRKQRDQTGCQAHGPDLKVRCPSGLGAYPDVIVVCEKPEFDDGKKLVLTNPKIIFEVLSPSTMTFDRGKKKKHYRSIRSLTHYVIVSQNQAWVEVYIPEAGGRWLNSDYDFGSFELATGTSSLKFDLDEIYNGIEFPPLEVFRDEEESSE